MTYGVVFNDLFRFIGALGRELRATRGRYFVIVVPVLWLVLFFLVPFLIVLKFSYAVSDPSVRPPYSALISFATQDTLAITLSLRNYLMLLADPLYVGAFLRSLLFAGVSTGVALLIGYPIAYGIARARPFPRLVLLTSVILPFCTRKMSTPWPYMVTISPLTVAMCGISIFSPDFS